MRPSIGEYLCPGYYGRLTLAPPPRSPIIFLRAEAAAEAKRMKLRENLAHGELYVTVGLMYTYRAKGR